MYVSMCCGNINMSPVQVNLLKRFVSDFKNKILIIVVIVLTHSIHWSVLLYSYRFVNYYFFIEYPLIKSPLVPAEVPVWDFCYPLDILMSWQIPPKLTIIDGYCERGRPGFRRRRQTGHFGRFSGISQVRVICLHFTPLPRPGEVF